MITPKDIEMKEFSRTKVGGYKPEEVDEFLDRILADYESLLEEREALNKRITYLNDKVEKARDDNDKMRSAVVTNQKSYDDMIGNAKKKADKIVADAQDYARRLIETAKEEADHQQQVKTQLTAEVESFKSRLLAIYENHVKLISTIPVFQKNDNEYESGALEMLKVATADMSQINSPDDYEEPESVSDLDNLEDDIVVPSSESTILMPSVHVEKQSESPRTRRLSTKNDDDLEFDDEDDDIDDVSANDKQIKGLFSSEKKKKSLFGNGKKKTSIFSKYNDDDDDDDDEDDDE